MRSSKFFNIDPNILIEYIHDDSNLLGESYNILYNSKTNLRSFVSADDSETNNDLYNQLYKIDTIQNRFSNVPWKSPNSLKEGYSFLQLKNYSSSIPIRYDYIKIHVPVNYVFEDKKGFYIRVYTLDYDNTSQVNLSNYYFNITDIEQNYKIQYTSPLFIQNEKQWGKYLLVSVPSITKVSDQRINNITKENSINWNISNSKGLSKSAPIFIDFHFIESIDIINDVSFFNLSPVKTVSLPQTPEFEKLGVKIEKSPQGDFFLIYATYNGTSAEFSSYLNESYYSGNRYHIEYQIDLFEKNVKTKSQTIIVDRDFSEEIEYRPVLKFTTSTAIIDVKLKLIDSVDSSEITREASYGMLQDEVSNYSSRLTKIDLKRSHKQDVFNIKNILTPNVSDLGNVRPLLILEKLAFSVFSQKLNVINESQTVKYKNIKWFGKNKVALNIFPFDNIIKFEILKNDEDSYSMLDLNDYQDLKLTIKGDSKTIEVGVYKESDQNDYSSGKIVFNITQGKYQDIKKIQQEGFNIFYINGIDTTDNKEIIYNGIFTAYDLSQNINQLESSYNLLQRVPSETLEFKSKDLGKMKAIKNSKSLPKSVNSKQKAPTKDKILDTTNYIWKIPSDLIQYSIGKKDYIHPKETWSFKKQIISLGVSNDKYLDNKIEYILGYFKGLDINPNSINLEFVYGKDEFKSNIDSYVNSGIFNKKSDKYKAKKESEIKKGEFLPSDNRKIQSMKSK